MFALPIFAARASYRPAVGSVRGTLPGRKKGTTPKCSSLAPPVGLEPTTCGLTVRRSTD